MREGHAQPARGRTLTLGTDNPAFPPWWGGADEKPWKVSNPYSGKGYESAVVYAIARQLGFAKARCSGRRAVPHSFARRKNFDFYMTQVSYARAGAAVDFSHAYYFVNQAVVGREGTPIAKAKSIAALKPYKLGAQLGTTSYKYITRYIRPPSSRAPTTRTTAIQALKNGQIDGIVVDLPTAFYVTAVQLDDGVIVGQLPHEGQGALRAGLPEGQHAPPVRRQGDRQPVGERDDQALQNTWLAKARRA